MSELQRPAGSSPLITSHIVLGRVVEHATGGQKAQTRRSATVCAPRGHRRRAPQDPSRRRWPSIDNPPPSLDAGWRTEHRDAAGGEEIAEVASSPHPFPHLGGIVARNWYAIAGCSSGFSHLTMDREFGGGEDAGWATGVPLRAPDTMLPGGAATETTDTARVHSWQGGGRAPERLGMQELSAPIRTPHASLAPFISRDPEDPRPNLAVLALFHCPPSPFEDVL